MTGAMWLETKNNNLWEDYLITLRHASIWGGSESIWFRAVLDAFFNVPQSFPLDPAHFRLSQTGVLPEPPRIPWNARTRRPMKRSAKFPRCVRPDIIKINDIPYTEDKEGDSEYLDATGRPLNITALLLAGYGKLKEQGTEVQ
ncbi:MAG: hypothetical protein M1833_003066 [Piccolia ochrophora]|nr:MAG: hypothetical protein M1833_003066 [Piccolia ochrophora]